MESKQAEVIGIEGRSVVLRHGERGERIRDRRDWLRRYHKNIVSYNSWEHRQECESYLFLGNN